MNENLHVDHTNIIFYIVSCIAANGQPFFSKLVALNQLLVVLDDKIVHPAVPDATSHT